MLSKGLVTLEVFQLQNSSVSNLGVIQNDLNSLFRMQKDCSEFEKWISKLKRDTVLFLFKMVPLCNVYTHNLLHGMHLIFFKAMMYLHFLKMNLIFFSIYIFQIFIKLQVGKERQHCSFSFLFPPPPTPCNWKQAELYFTARE